MTTKDCEAFAAMCRELRRPVWPQDHAVLAVQMGLVEEAIADVLIASNPRVDKARFLKACRQSRQEGL